MKIVTNLLRICTKRVINLHMEPEGGKNCILSFFILCNTMPHQHSTVSNLTGLGFRNNSEMCFMVDISK